MPLTAAYRSLSRPSSAPSAKAFPLCSCSLNQYCVTSRRLATALRNLNSNYAGNLRDFARSPPSLSLSRLRASLLTKLLLFPLYPVTLPLTPVFMRWLRQRFGYAISTIANIVPSIAFTCSYSLHASLFSFQGANRQITNNGDPPFIPLSSAVCG